MTTPGEPMRRLRAALLSSPALWAAGLWGFAEATLFFVVPDVLFTLTTLFAARRGLWQMGVSILGAVLAGAVMYSWAATSPAQARAVVAAVPFVGEKIITPFERRWDEGGTWALFRNPLGGVPYKVPAVLAPARLSLVEFLALSVPLRAERMIFSMIVFLPLAWWIGSGGSSERRQVWGLGVHAVFWTIVYGVYWSINW